MKPIPKQRIDDSVYKQLSENIRKGTWQSGEKLPSESELCRIFQVSRVSIRSALQRLHALGLIEVKRAKGSFVCGAADLFDFSQLNFPINLRLDEFIEIQELHRMLEASSIETLFKKNQPMDLGDLNNALEGMSAAAAKQDMQEFNNHDHVFHMSIILAAGNSKLIQIAQIFRLDLYRLFNESNKLLLRGETGPSQVSERFEESVIYHRFLRDSILRKDENVLDFQREHCENLLVWVKNYFKDHDKKVSQRLLSPLSEKVS